VFFISGFILLIFAIFAKQLGIDNDEGWGMGRILLLSTGIIIISTGFISVYSPSNFSIMVHFFSTKKHILLAATIVGIVYIWVAQTNIKSNKENYNYYSELAKSYRAGHTYLAEKPSAALLSLENPYNYNIREEANVSDFPWDVSLYNKKFYLYWGPAPAVILSAFNPEQLSQIKDKHLVIAFAIGLFIYLTLMAMKFFERSLPNAPSWLLGLLILILGLTAPITIMIQESRVYQVAVFGSQFFFIGGCYWIYIAINNKQFPIWNLVIAGIHWALALGTRVTIAPVILWSATITIVYIFISFKPSVKKLFFSLASIGIPLLMVVAGLGWYNWTRFGSVAETGITYQLTGTNYMVFKKLFAGSYMGRNFYNYFFHPLKTHPAFPYLFRIEYIFTSERMGGLIFIAPFIILGFLPIRSIIRGLRSTRGGNKKLNIEINTEHWLLLTFAGTAVISIFTILAFWWTEMRYLEDFMPSLLLFIIVGIGREYRALENNIRGQKILIFVTTILGCITIIASTLVALKSDSLVFWMETGDTILKILKLK